MNQLAAVSFRDFPPPDTAQQLAQFVYVSGRIAVTKYPLQTCPDELNRVQVRTVSGPLTRVHAVISQQAFRLARTMSLRVVLSTFQLSTCRFGVRKLYTRLRD